jgi:predicted secreted protein
MRGGEPHRASVLAAPPGAFLPGHGTRPRATNDGDLQRGEGIGMNRWWRVLRPEGSERPGERPPSDRSLETAGTARATPRAGGRNGNAVVVPITLGRRPRPGALRRNVELSGADHGRTVRTQVGEEFLLRLPEDWASGYTWQFTDPVDELLAVVGSAFEGASPAGPGRGGHLVMRLRGRRPGVATIRLVLGRLWGGEPMRTFEVTVRVVEQGDGPHGAD